MALIVLIEDDAPLVDVLSLAFADAGHRVESAADGLAGLALVERVRPDVVVSDVNMPRLDGFTLCRRLRAAGSDVPLLLLTSRDGEIDEALGLDLGADDYVAKPFSTRVLLARVQALLRRQELRGGGVGGASVRRVGELELDGERLEVRYRGAPIAVTVTEFRLLEALAGRPGVVQSRARLMELARGDDSTVAERIVDTYVRRLRRKLEAIDPRFDGIVTVVGAGYSWRDGGA
jgi:DNA-binding response OmpR family regulator